MAYGYRACASESTPMFWIIRHLLTFGRLSRPLRGPTPVNLFMRRLVVVLLMFLLPLQATWGMAASYCQHEQEATIGHFGHHTHQHKANAGNLEKAKSSASVGVDGDCEVCHLGTVQVVTATPSSATAASTANPPTARVVVYDSHIPDGLERPNRTRAA